MAAQGFDMTDEEILKRIAEIEGWEVDDDGIPYEEGPLLNRFRDPLTNWSDLGPLIEKYGAIILAPIGKDEKIWKVFLALPGGLPVHHESLPHAICLAIIEAHK